MQDDELLSEGDVAHYVSLVREGNPNIEGSKGLLRLFCASAKKLKFPVSPFPEPLLELLISAFEKYLSGEERDLEKALGLKRRGKPVDPNIEKRNILIALDVLRLNLDNKPLVDNKNEQGAFSTVAEARNLSESMVSEIYYKHHDDAMAVELCSRLQVND